MADNSGPGRPTVITEKAKQDLLIAFGYNANVVAACAHAKVSTSAFYEFLKAEPEFQDRINEVKNTPYLFALQAIIRQLSSKDADPEFALKYLERRHPEEFRKRTQLADPDDNPVNTGHEELKTIAETLKNANSGRPPLDPSLGPAGLDQAPDTSETAS